MNELSDELIRWLKEKINSPLYIVFIVAYISWNWRFFYALFIEDKIPDGVTRYEFAQQYVFSFPWDTGFPLLQLFLDCANILLLSVFIPLALTYFALYELPKIHEIVHKKSLSFYFRRKLEYDRQYSEYAEQKTDELRAVEKQVIEQRKVTENIAKQSVATQSVKNSLSEDDIWETEYQSLKKSREYFNLADLQKTSMSPYMLDPSEFGKLTYAHVSGLATIDKKARTVDLTEKGKYFLKRFLQEKGS